MQSLAGPDLEASAREAGAPHLPRAALAADHVGEDHLVGRLLALREPDEQAVLRHAEALRREALLAVLVVLLRDAVGELGERALARREVQGRRVRAIGLGHWQRVLRQPEAGHGLDPVAGPEGDLKAHAVPLGGETHAPAVRQDLLLVLDARRHVLGGRGHVDPARLGPSAARAQGPREEESRQTADTPHPGDASTGAGGALIQAARRRCISRSRRRFASTSTFGGCSTERCPPGTRTTSTPPSATRSHPIVLPRPRNGDWKRERKSVMRPG